MLFILVTNSIEQSPSSESNSYSVKKFHVFYGTQMFITVFIRAHHWFLSWVRWIQSTLSHPVSLTSSLTLPSHLMPRSSKWSLPLTNILYEFLFHACYMVHPSHLPRFDHPNYIWWSLQVMKLLIMQSSAASCNLLHLRSKYTLCHSNKAKY